MTTVIWGLRTLSKPQILPLLGWISHHSSFQIQPMVWLFHLAYWMVPLREWQRDCSTPSMVNVTLILSVSVLLEVLDLLKFVESTLVTIVSHFVYKLNLRPCDTQWPNFSVNQTFAVKILVMFCYKILNLKFWLSRNI